MIIKVCDHTEVMTPKIKICGLMKDCDVDYINEAHPDYVGFIFAHTRREISAEDARRFRRKLAEGIQAVGVFVDEESERAVRLLREGIIDIVQLHGHEDAAYVEALKRKTGCLVIKALNPKTGQREGRYEDYVKAGVDYFLFDNGNVALAGGTGKTFDWSLIPDGNHPFFLAGGLHAGNIEDAIYSVKPYAVDISSGVETDGVKDRGKILEIVRRVRNV